MPFQRGGAQCRYGNNRRIDIGQAVDYQTEAAALGGAEETLRPEQVSEFVATAVEGVEVGNQRVCLVVPDGTRTCPLPSLGITPVRALIDEAASMIPTRRLALSLVVASGTNTLYALAFGTPEESWAARADISSQTHVTYFDHPVRRVLSIMPTKYQDIWTAAKGFYKLEPIVADGGEVIIYAPHITQISVMYPSISEIGYHNRDYFLGQWDKFRNKPWGDLAHSTFDLRVAPFDRVCRVIKPRGRVQHGTSGKSSVRRLELSGHNSQRSAGLLRGKQRRVVS